MSETGRVSLPHGTVTFLFSDIEDSTVHLRRLGQEAFASVRADHHRLLREAITAHGGREVDTAGDGFFVAFERARGAVAAAVDAQVALTTFTWPAAAEVRVRMGLHTAEPHVSEEGTSASESIVPPVSAERLAAAKSWFRMRLRASSRTQR